MANLSLSPAGLRFLEAHEGYRQFLYNDANGFATIGYGHLVHRGPVGTNDQAESPFKGGLAKAPAAILLARDCARAEAGVRTFIRPNLKQHEFDALVSFTFNCGVGALQRSTLRRYVNSLATPDAIASAWLLWNHPPAILRRRRDEISLFNEGTYGGPVP